MIHPTERPGQSADPAARGNSPVRLVQCNAYGSPCGTSNGRARYADSVVAEARQQRASGRQFRAIAADLGIAVSTAFRWCTFLRRKPAARIIVKRIKVSMA